MTIQHSEYHEGLNSDQALQISRLSSGKSFVGKRKKFVFNAFTDFEPM